MMPISPNTSASAHGSKPLAGSWMVLTMTCPPAATEAAAAAAAAEPAAAAVGSNAGGGGAARRARNTPPCAPRATNCKLVT